MSQLKVLSVAKYNLLQTMIWQKHWNKAAAENRWGCMPQLAMYISTKNYGYWAFDKNTAIWGKTKLEAKNLFNQKYKLK